MIAKQDILDRVTELGMRPEVVEKDYVLSWILVALSQHPITSARWILKGGTCLKKCFLDTYRFSEDLDFSLTTGAPYDEGDLLQIIREVAALTTELSGIDVPSDRVSLKPRHDKLKRPTFQAKLAYQGPLKQPGWPKISFDITAHEPILTTPSPRSINHGYADTLPEGTTVRCYSIDELLAEKTRALAERTRPRDLYDVVHLREFMGEQLQPSVLRELLRKKFEVKGLKPPSMNELVKHVRESAELRADWTTMLENQLPALIPIEGVLERIEAAVDWLNEAAVVPTPQLAPFKIRPDEQILPTASIRGGGLDTIRFGASNRQLVSLDYHGTPRLVEPYSLRRRNTGNLLLYAWEVGSGQIKAFKVAEIANASVTDRPFVARYRVEL